VHSCSDVPLIEKIGSSAQFGVEKDWNVHEGANAVEVEMRIVMTESGLSVCRIMSFCWRYLSPSC